MSALDPEIEQRSDNRFYGVAVGQVTNNQDPQGLGRVKLKFPWWSDDDESHWARVACFMAGSGRGAFFLPEVDDEVLVAFEHGDIHRPYVIGALWNGQAKPPADNASGKNDIRLIKSRSGHTVRLDDTEGAEKIAIVDKGGTNSITIDSKQNTITIKADKDVVIEAPQGKIRLTAQNIEIKSSADTKVEAQASMDVKANGTLNVKGATVNIN